MTDPITAVFFHIDSENPGGGSWMLLRLLEKIDKYIFNPILVLQKKGKVHKKAKELNVEVVVVPFSGVLDTYNRKLLSSSMPTKIAATGRVLQYNMQIRSIISKAEVIWCESLRMVLTLLPTAVLSTNPVIWNIGLGMESEGMVRYLNTVALRVSDHVFIESEEQAKRVFTEKQYNRHRDQFTAFHKGIDTEKFDPECYDQTKKKDDFRIGTAASLTPRKGLEHLIDAIPQILKEDADAKLFIAGETPEGNEDYSQKLHNQVEKHGIGKHVAFLGWVDDMPEYLSTLDIFVLPSLNEGIPGAVREALAMEVPVVATDVGGTSEAVLHGKTGYLVEPEDSEQIAEKVIQLLSHQSEREELGKQGRKHMVENFSIESYVQDYEEFLKDIAGGH